MATHSNRTVERPETSKYLSPIPKNPLVSMIIPNYNHAQFLDESIRSILDQDYNAIELLIMDGGSTDGSLNILHKYDSDPRVRWVSEPDEGPLDAWFKGLRLAAGDLMGVLSSTEIYLPGAIRGLVDEFESDQSLGLVGGWSQTVDVHGTPTGRKRILRDGRFDFTVEDVVRTRGMPSTMGSLVRRDVQLSVLSDHDASPLSGSGAAFGVHTLLEVFRRGGRARAIPIMCYNYREHPNQRGFSHGLVGYAELVSGFTWLTEFYKDFLTAAQARTLRRVAYLDTLKYRFYVLGQRWAAIPAALTYIRHGGGPHLLASAVRFVMRRRN